MKIEFDSNNLSETDIAILKVLLEDKIKVEVVNKIVETAEKSNQFVQKKRYKIADYLALFDKDTSWTILEIARKLGNSPEASYHQINKLVRQKKLMASIGRPKRYYLREFGDPELNQSLLGSKISFMGSKV